MAFWSKKNAAGGVTETVAPPPLKKDNWSAPPVASPPPAAPLTLEKPSVLSSRATKPASDPSVWPDDETKAAPAPTEQIGLPQADIEKRAAASQRLLLSFGQIVSVLARSPQFRTLPLSEIEGLVGPAIMAGQFLVAEALSNGAVAPVAVALWANVSDEVDRRLSENLEQAIRIEPKDWRSGDIPWLILLAGDRRAITPLLKQFQDGPLKGRAPKMRIKAQDGKTIVTTFTATAPQG